MNKWVITNKDNCDVNLTWDYKGWGEYSSPTPYTQKNWNQTLVTKINQCSAHIYKASYVGGATHIIIHPSKTSLIESLEYYKDGSLSGKYKVEVDDSIGTNIIFVTNKDFLSKKFIATHEKVDEGQVLVKLKDRYTEEEAIEYWRGLTAYIEIENYG